MGREDQVRTVGYYVKRTNQQGTLASKSRYVNLGSQSSNLRGQLEQEHNVRGKKQMVLCRPKSRLGFFHNLLQKTQEITSSRCVLYSCF